MQKQTKNLVEFYLPVSKMFLMFRALGDCYELQIWHHGSQVSVYSVVLYGPMPRLLVWVPSWGSRGRTELLLLLSYYAMAFTIKILPSEFPPGKMASQKAGEKNEQFSVLKHECSWWRKGCLLERAPRAQNKQEKMMSKIFLPRELYLQSTKAQCHVPGKKIAKGMQESCLWVIVLTMSHSGFSLMCSWQCVPYHFPVMVQPLLHCQPSKTETSLPPGFFLSL